MSWFHRTITVPADARAVEYVDGAFARVLGPGRHARPLRRVTYRWVTVREQLMPMPPQEVPTSDGLSVRVSTSLRWAVAEPRAFVEVAVDPTASVYLAVQVSLRDALAEVPVAEALRLHFPCVAGVVNPSIPRSTTRPRISPVSSFAQTTAMSAKGALLIHILEPLRIR